MDDKHRLMQRRIKKREELLKAGTNPYPYNFNRRESTETIQKKYAKLKPEEETDDDVSIAGRLVLLRRMGKATFGHLQDGSGRVQFFASKSDLGDEYDLIKSIDLGDFIGVEGRIFVTKRGEVTVKASKIILLAKSIRPLPEKHHGLQDVETRYRKRYLDLITNEKSRKRFFQRATIIKSLRSYLDNHGLLEVETPTLQPIYGGGNAKPFTTHNNSLKTDLFLRISDELYLKRLLIGGIDGVYEICKDFRNEGIDTKHNPEFTMLEWYLPYADYEDGIRMTEEIIASATKILHGTTKIMYQGEELDLTPPWKRVTMADMIVEHAKIDVLNMGEEELREFCKKNSVEIEEYDTWGLLVQHIFEHFCEEHLIQPTFIIDHPKETTPFCKEHRSDKRLVERFELFIRGMEICNAYSELNDPLLQKEHLFAQVERRKRGDEEAQPMDEEFVEALEYGMPPTSGVGMGVDRVVMLLTDSPSIRDVILFPVMRSEERTSKDKRDERDKKDRKDEKDK